MCIYGNEMSPAEFKIFLLLIFIVICVEELNLACLVSIFNVLLALKMGHGQEYD